jgi:hypothetical protein
MKMKFFIEFFILINLMPYCLSSFPSQYNDYSIMQPQQPQQLYSNQFYNKNYYPYNPDVNGIISQPIQQQQQQQQPQINPYQTSYSNIPNPQPQPSPLFNKFAKMGLPQQQQQPQSPNKETSSKYFQRGAQQGQSRRVFKFEESSETTEKTILASATTTKPIIKECGILKPLITNFVANGKTTPHNKWPWHAQIIIDGNDEDESETYCGGTLISKNFILTAAHCYDDLHAAKRARNTQILLNGISLPPNFKRKSKSGGAALKFRAINVYLHPDYVPAMSENEADAKNQLPGPRNDLALVEINVSDKQINDLLMPICLPASGYQLRTQTKCKIMGHGFMSDKDEDNFVMPTQLQMADVSISSNTACRNEVDSESIKLKINSDTICIRGPIHPCVGDSGGPLLCEGSSRTLIHGNLEDDEEYDENDISIKKWFLTGVTSFAVSTDENDKCGQFKSAVFGKVSHNIDWINRITGLNEF